MLDDAGDLVINDGVKRFINSTVVQTHYFLLRDFAKAKGENVVVRSIGIVQRETTILTGQKVDRIHVFG